MNGKNNIGNVENSIGNSKNNIGNGKSSIEIQNRLLIWDKILIKKHTIISGRREYSGQSFYGRLMIFESKARRVQRSVMSKSLDSFAIS